MKKALAAVGVAIMASGCSGVDDYASTPKPGTSGTCSLAIGGGAATAEGTSSAGCVGCEVSDAANAIDGSNNTYATMTYPIGSSGSVTITATAQSGVIFPSGSNATVFLNFQNGHSGTIFLRTLMDGVVQNQSSQTNGIGYEGNTSTVSFSVGTSNPFDAVQLEITDSQSQESREMWVREICADANGTG